MPVLLPETIDQACTMLAEHASAIPLAGGTDLLVHWPQQLSEHAKTFLDLSKLTELKPLKWTDTELVLGGLTTYWDVIQEARAWKEFPLLIEAGRQVGAVQIQARGTWAGNIINASPAADGVPVLMAYDAVVELVSQQGSEHIALSDFYLGYKQMRRCPEQLIRAIRIPLRKYTFQLFEKVGSRRAQAITKVGVAVTCSDAGWRVVANSVAPTVCRCPSIEKLLEGGTRLTSDQLLAAIRQDISPIDDIRSTAAYREQVLAHLLSHGVAAGS